MSEERGPSLRLRARGPLACFTRPELKVERVSYPIITPSAARGLIEAVLWKPAILWHIDRIEVLKEIRFTSFRRNEVSRKASTPSKDLIVGGGEFKSLFVEDERAQRNTVALSHVDYVIHAHFTMTDRRGPQDNVNKFVDMFSRRVERGQHFHQPYFGCREFVADIMSADGAPRPIEEDRDLGIMLWDIQFQKGKNRPLFFEARMNKGVVEIPSEPMSLLRRSTRGGAS